MACMYVNVMNGNVLYTEGGAFTAFEHLYVDKFGLSYNEACKLKHAQMVDKKSLVQETVCHMHRHPFLLHS